MVTFHGSPSFGPRLRVLWTGLFSEPAKQGGKIGAAHCRNVSQLVFSSTVSKSRCIVKGEAPKSPLFWRFSGGF